jgi:hypothetical protein
MNEGLARKTVSLKVLQFILWYVAVLTFSFAFVKFFLPPGCFLDRFIVGVVSWSRVTVELMIFYRVYRLYNQTLAEVAAEQSAPPAPAEETKP